MKSTRDSLFAEYHCMLIDFQDDTLSWKELDSLQIHKLTLLSQIPSSVQNFALAARALRGDTAYYRFPAENIEYFLRTAEKEPKKKASTEPAFNLFPNPNNGSFTIRLDGDEGIYNYSVIDLTGRQLLQNHFSKSKGTQLIPIQFSLNNGIYLIGLTTNDGTLVGLRKIFLSN